MIAGSGPNRKANIMSLPVSRDRQWRDPALTAIPPGFWGLPISPEAKIMLGCIATQADPDEWPTWTPQMLAELVEAGFIVAKADDLYEFVDTAWRALWAR